MMKIRKLKLLGTALGLLMLSTQANAVLVSPTSGTTSIAAVRTITAGGTSQVVFIHNASRQDCIIQNLSAGTLTISFASTAASATTITLPQYAVFTCVFGNMVITDAINIFGATTGASFYATEILAAGY